MSYFKLDNVSSETYDVILTGSGTYAAPQRSFEAVSVPGRDGDLLFDNGRYENVIIQYEAGIVGKDKLDQFRAWLLSHTSYCRLEDSYHPDEYRMAMPINGLAPSMEVMLKIGRFPISFNCKPQRFLKTGETATTMTSSGTIKNETLFVAKPLIRVYGYGTLRVGGSAGTTTVTIAQHSLSYIDLDCDTEDSFRGSTNANSYITLSGDHYPRLYPGNNSITMSGSISSVAITPRWWTL